MVSWCSRRLLVGLAAGSLWLVVVTLTMRLTSRLAPNICDNP